MKKIFQFFSRLFSKMINYYQSAMSKAKPFLQKEIPVAIRVVQALKRVIDSQAMDIVTAIIPGKFDDVAVIAARSILPVVLLKLGIVKNIASGATNDDVIQAAALEMRKLKLIDNSRYGKTLLDIASEISHALIDGKISLSELATIIHGFYESQKPELAEFRQAA